MKDRNYLLGRRQAIVTGLGVMASLLAACTSSPASNETAVNLVYTKNGRLTGTLHGRPVDLTSQLPVGSGTLGGTVAGEPIDASWQVAYNGTKGQQVVPATLHGKLAKQSVSLDGLFRLMPDLLFDSGNVTGTAGGRPVRAQASRASGESSSSVNVGGSFAGTPFSLYATLASDLTSGLIRGNVGGKPTHLTAKSGSSRMQITGDYSGPSALFVLATGCLLYFLGGIYSA